MRCSPALPQGLASWLSGVSDHRLFSWHGFSRSRGEPASSAERKTLSGDFNYCFKSLALGHFISHKWQWSTRNESSLWLSPIGETSCQALRSISTAEAQEELKPLQSESGLKLVALWSLPPKHHLARKFPPMGYFPSLHLHLLSPWHEHLLVSASAASSLSASEEPLP